MTVYLKQWQLINSGSYEFTMSSNWCWIMMQCYSTTELYYSCHTGMQIS